MSETHMDQDNIVSDDQAFRSGYVSIIGAPNVGKSTLLNAFLGQKLAIVTPKPQTTRNQIRGIVTTDTHQIVFVDTPGLMDPKYRLQSEMVRTAYGALRDADIVLFIVDGAYRNVDTENQILNRLQKTQAAKKILVINKVDLVDKPTILPVFDEFSRQLDFDEMIPISAKTRDGVDLLLGQVKSLLPPGPQYFPEDQLSDLPERFFISETVREKIMLMTKREVPYST
ncbi:GTPase Era, partial [Candidatus Poribacteria bacterium]|nr:GTPase Era [Candidatus Poribacteria bacterium]